jgi:uncharacterized protein (TIGR02996 family)
MTPADAFLEDILQHPADDTPRLIFADWLEEQNDPASRARGEFIRVQCRLAQLAGVSSEKARLEERQDELLAQYGATWAEPICDLVSGWSFHRGFIARIITTVRLFLEGPDRLFRFAPIQNVRLGGVNDYHRGAAYTRLGVTLAECPYLARLSTLHLPHMFLDSFDLQALAASDYLTSLVRLDLAENRIGGPGIRSLVSAPLFAQLRFLDLSNNDLDGVSVRVLGKALLELAERGEMVMECLDLSGNTISWQARRTITTSPLLRRIVRLS